MAFVTADRVMETTATAGAGALALGGAITTDGGFQRFSAAMAVGDTCEYGIKDSSTTAWEVGLGTYSALNTLTRTTVYASSNVNNAVVLSGDTTTVVFIALTASRIAGFAQIKAGTTVTAGSTGTFAAGQTLLVVRKTTGSATGITLPANPLLWTIYSIKDGKGDAATNPITVTPASGLVDGAATAVITVAYENLMFFNDGISWNLA